MNEELKKEARELLDDQRTGLRASSDTNKTRFAILALIDLATLAERKRCAEIVEKLEKDLDLNRFEHPTRQFYCIRWQAVYDLLQQSKKAIATVIERREHGNL